MKILIIHEIDWEKKVIFEPHHLSELFSNNGHDVFVMECKAPDISHFKSNLKTIYKTNYNRIYSGATITLISSPTLLIKGLNRFSNYLFCKKIIENVVRDNQIEIILLYGVATNGRQAISIAKKFNIPLVFRVLDVAHKLVKIPPIQLIVKNNEKYILQNASKVITTTPSLVNYAIQMGSNHENTETFPLGVNMNQFCIKNLDLDLMKIYGFSTSDKIFAFMGTLYDFAGLKNIIISFSKIQHKIPNAKFLIIGGGPDESNLKLLIKKYNHQDSIKITGFLPQNEIASFLAMSILCINPFEINKITEHILPTKILEYFACQKPVLSTPLKGTIELLPDERFGIVYSSSEKFIQSLINLLLDEEKLEKLKTKGYEYVLNNHEWNKLTKNLLLDFESIVKNYPKRYK